MSPLHKPLPAPSLAIVASILLFTQACAGRDASPAPLDDAAAVSPQPTASENAFVPPETVAGAALASALAEARATDRLLFVHSGADW